MPPKKSKSNNESRSEAEPGPERQNAAENSQIQEKGSKNTQLFKCICGKTYGSLAAVHTHINNKHPDEKKKYKAQIINPKKIGQTASTSIRMKDINFNESEAELMCHADINLKAIYEYYTEVEKNLKENDILIVVNDDLSDDSDIEGEGNEGDVRVGVESKRRKEINEAVRKMQQEYKMGEIIHSERQHKDLETFKLQKFRLNIVTELSKFFIPKFAARIQFSIYLIHASEKAGSSNEEVKTRVESALQQVWKTNPNIKAQLFRYYREWNRIRYHYKSWKSEQFKNERT